MADPLSLLREFSTSGRLELVRLDGDAIRFGDQYVFPKATPTAFKGQREGHYSLEVALYVAQHRQLSQPEYLKAASSAGLAAAPYVDRKVRACACACP